MARDKLPPVRAQWAGIRDPEQYASPDHGPPTWHALVTRPGGREAPACSPGVDVVADTIRGAGLIRERHRCRRRACVLRWPAAPAHGGDTPCVDCRSCRRCRCEDAGDRASNWLDVAASGSRPRVALCWQCRSRRLGLGEAPAPRDLGDLVQPLPL